MINLIWVKNNYFPSIKTKHGNYTCHVFKIWKLNSYSLAVFFKVGFDKNEIIFVYAVNSEEAGKKLAKMLVEAHMKSLNNND